MYYFLFCMYLMPRIELILSAALICRYLPALSNKPKIMESHQDLDEICLKYYNILIRVYLVQTLMDLADLRLV